MVLLVRREFRVPKLHTLHITAVAALTWRVVVLRMGPIRSDEQATRSACEGVRAIPFSLHVDVVQSDAVVMGRAVDHRIVLPHVAIPFSL